VLKKNFIHYLRNSRLKISAVKLLFKVAEQTIMSIIFHIISSKYIRRLVTTPKPQVIMFTPRLWRGVKQFYHQFMSNYDYFYYVKIQFIFI